tara:strand:+ start:3735 stop:4259 length:525 start_codon:yes stop_codon:yes gene_type:complete
MATFKRLKLFVNLSKIDDLNIIYDETWIYKLASSGEELVGRYRIRYQKSTNPMIFSGEDGFDSEELGEIQDSMDIYGPAIICNLETWTADGWKKCLDWIGDPALHYLSACQDLNDQYRSFLTGKPILDPFISSPSSTPPSSPKTYKPIKKADKKETESKNPKEEDSDSTDLDWI